MDALMGFINNPAVLTIAPILWGLAVKYNPAWKDVPNAIIPYATAIVAFLVKVFSPENAQAGPLEAMFVTKLPLLGFFGGVIATALSAGWQAIQNSLIYEVFLRHPANAVLQKP